MTTVNDKNAELTIATSSKKTSGEPLIQEGAYTLLNEALHIRADDVKVVKGVTLIVA